MASVMMPLKDFRRGTVAGASLLLPSIRTSNPLEISKRNSFSFLSVSSMKKKTKKKRFVVVEGGDGNERR